MNTEKERADLLPCPFCGSTNIEIQISTPDREGVPTNLMCSDCGASGPWEYEQGNSHAKADAAWNTRAAMQSQDREDTVRLDWLDSMNAKLNSKYGTTYRWELVLSPHVVRLMAGNGGSGHMAAIDLNDSAANGVPSCREAIDQARRLR